MRRSSATLSVTAGTSKGGFLCGQLHGGMVSHKGIEWGHSRGRVAAVVICELGLGEKPCPIILLVVGVGSEVLLQSLVLLLSLPIGLGVERCA